MPLIRNCRASAWQAARRKCGLMPSSAFREAATANSPLPTSSPARRDTAGKRALADVLHGMCRASRSARTTKPSSSPRPPSRRLADARSPPKSDAGEWPEARMQVLFHVPASPGGRPPSRSRAMPCVSSARSAWPGASSCARGPDVSFLGLWYSISVGAGRGGYSRGSNTGVRATASISCSSIP
jgi:hypothetical protein